MRRGLLVGTLLAALTLSACGGVGDTGSQNYISGEGTVTSVDEADRTDAIELTGDGLDGEAIDVADWRGQVVVVNVWGAWCPPCRAEQDELVEAAVETEGTAQFVGVNIRDLAVENSRAFVRNYEVPYPSIYSPDSKALLAFSGTLTPYSIPSTVILDGEGRVAATIMGSVPSVLTLTELIKDVADETGKDGAKDGQKDGAKGAAATGRDGTKSTRG
ncbi:MAG: TlpA family protein disulfide reductase [Nocardioides sp.]|uniref:TlpA family protein disulfide reductase n=1 Tax=Nocardioides sp. TaxID=35761 RepID=UPI003F06A11C